MSLVMRTPSLCIVSTHTAPYAYSSCRSSMRTLPPHTSDLRIKLPVAVCVGIVHIIFTGSSKGTHTAPNKIFKLTYPAYVQTLRPLLRKHVVSYQCNYTMGGSRGGIGGSAPPPPLPSNFQTIGFAMIEFFGPPFSEGGPP